jgi:aminocarboxymuconate-semialdehyde decarboxylase
MKIDLHAHFALPDWNTVRVHADAPAFPALDHCEPCAAYLLANGKRTLRVPQSAWKPDERIADMDRMGIDMQVLSPIPTLFGYEFDVAQTQRIARAHNEYVAGLAAERPERFAGMAMVPLQAPDLAAEEVRDAHDRLGLHAVEIGTTAAGIELDDDALLPFFAACSELDVSIFVHPAGRQAGFERMNRYYLPNIVGNPLESALAAARLMLGGVLERFPDLRICFAHCGGALPAVIGRLQHAWTTREDTRERTTRGPLETARLLYFDSLTHDAPLLKHIVETLGFTRIVVGSDYPFVYLGEKDPIGFLGRSGLDAAAIARITGENAAAFLGTAAVTR